MNIKKLLGLILSSIVLATGCGDSAGGVAGKVKSAGIDTSATIADHNKAKVTFQSTFGEIQGVVAEAVSKGIAEAAGGVVPAQAGSQSYELDTTISDEGASLTLVGTVSVEASADGTVIQDQDVTVTWTGFKISVSDTEVTTSGKVVMTANINIGAEGAFTGSSSQVGQITADGETFGFEIDVTISATEIKYSGTINGQTEEFTVDLAALDSGGTGSESAAGLMILAFTNGDISLSIHYDVSQGVGAFDCSSPNVMAYNDGTENGSTDSALATFGTKCAIELTKAGTASGDEIEGVFSGTFYVNSSQSTFDANGSFRATIL